MRLEICCYSVEDEVLAYQNSNVSMSASNQSEYFRYAVDPNEILKLKQLTSCEK